MLVVWDLETTGFCPVGLMSKYHRIVEITMRHDKSGDIFDAVVNPNMKIPPWSTNVHGITNEDVAHAQPFENVWRDALQWIEAKRQEYDEKIVWMVAHNCFGFDAPVLEKEIERLNIGNGKLPSWMRFGDTLPLARRILPNRGHGEYALGKLFEFITGREMEGAHRASADAEALSHIVRHLKSLPMGGVGFDTEPPSPVKLTDVKQIGPWRARQLRNSCRCNNTVKGLRKVVGNNWRVLDSVLLRHIKIVRPSTRAVIISGVMGFDTSQTLKVLRQIERSTFIMDPVDAVIENYYVKDLNFRPFASFPCQVTRGLSLISHSQLGSRHVRW